MSQGDFSTLNRNSSFAELANGTKGFAVQNAFLKFTTTEEVTLKGEGMFSTGDEITITGNGTEQYVAVKPTATDVAFSYSVDGVQCKSLSKNFEVRKVYNLGELYGPSDWEISDGTRFLKTATPDLFVAKNVKLAANNFCLKNVNLAWGAVGAKYGLVTAGTKSVDAAIGIYNADWAGDITISNASTVAHDIYFDYANSRLYVLTVGKTPAEIAAPTHATYYDLAGTMNGWSGGTKFTYSGDNVWHLVVDMAANAEFKVRKDGGWTTCYGHYAIQENVGRSYSNGSDNAKMKAAGTYEIWVIPSHSPQLYIIKR